MKGSPKWDYKAHNVITIGLRLIRFVVKRLVILIWQHHIGHPFAPKFGTPYVEDLYINSKQPFHISFKIKKACLPANYALQIHIEKLWARHVITNYGPHYLPQVPLSIPTEWLSGTCNEYISWHKPTGTSFSSRMWYSHCLRSGKHSHVPPLLNLRTMKSNTTWKFLESSG